MVKRNYQISFLPIFQAGAFYPFSNRLGLEFRTESNGSSIPLNTFSIGLVRLTGKSISNNIQPDNFETTSTQAGNWLVSGGISYNSSASRTSYQSTFPSDTSITRSHIAFSPSVGLFVHKNLLVGVGLSYSLNRVNNSSPTANLSITPYVRKYIGNRQLRPYIQGNLYFSPVRWPKDTSGDVLKQKDFSASLGLAYIIGDHFIIDANLITVSAFYSSSNYHSGDSYKGWSWQGFGTMSPGIWLNYILSGKRMKSLAD